MHKWSIARWLFTAQLIFTLLLTGAVSWSMYAYSRDRTYAEVAHRMLTVATVISDDPFARHGVRNASASAQLQAYAVRIMNDADVDFVTIMDTDRTRYTHRNPQEICKSYIGSIAPALAGRSFTETYSGTLGPSVRAVVPIKNEGGVVIALVSVGKTVSNVAVIVNARLPIVFGIGLGVLLAGSLLSYAIGRYLKRVTLGRGALELAQMFIFYDSVLHSVREGVVLVDHDGQLVLYNDEAARLLALPPATRRSAPTPVHGLKTGASLTALLGSGRRARDEIHLTGDRLLVVNQEPALAFTESVSGPEPESRPGARSGRRGPTPAKAPRAAEGPRQAAQRTLGTVTTLRDHTELETLTGELASMRTLTTALRAQTHEHANRLHTIVSLIELGRGTEALEFATRDLAQSQQLADEILSAVDEPFLAALLMGKSAQAHERGIEFALSAAPGLRASPISPTELVTIIGNLLDNAFDAVASLDTPRRVILRLGETAGGLRIQVENNGPDLDAEQIDRMFRLGFSTKAAAGHGLGLALVQQAAARLGGRLQATGGGDAVFIVDLPLKEQPAEHHWGRAESANIDSTGTVGTGTEES